MKTVVSIVVSVLAAVASGAVQETGNISGKVTYRGRPPALQSLAVSGDRYCEKATTGKVSSEAVLVDAHGGVQNVFIYVKEGLSPTQTFDAPATQVALNQRGCRFEPHVFGVRAGQPFTIVNHDATLHNIHAKPAVNKPFNIGQPIAGMRAEMMFTEAEVMVPLVSDIHAWMSAFVGVVPHPFFTVSGSDGSFTINGLPPGRYTLEAWHETLGTATERVTVGRQQVSTVSFTFR